MDPIAKFWMVWGVQRGSPHYRHHDKASAVKEARRLASVTPGELFVVLAAVDAYRVAVPEPSKVPLTKPERIPDDDIPF